jgi:hypothetical protein
MPDFVSTCDASGTLSIWYISSLRKVTADLEVRPLVIASVADLDENLWFSAFGEVPTCRTVALHAKRILDADLRWPVILSPDGDVLDGMHRVSKAWILGVAEVAAVQLAVMPPPDEVIVGACKTTVPCSTGGHGLPPERPL